MPVAVVRGEPDPALAWVSELWPYLGGEPQARQRLPHLGGEDRPVPAVLCEHVHVRPAVVEAVDGVWLAVTFAEEAAAVYDDGSAAERRLAQLIRAVLSDGEGAVGDERGVYLLQRHDDDDVPRRQGPLPHIGPGAWTQGQRYASLDKLLAADTTADL